VTVTSFPFVSLQSASEVTVTCWEETEERIGLGNDL